MSFFRRLSRDRSSKSGDPTGNNSNDLPMPIRAQPYSDGTNTTNNSHHHQASLYKDTQYPSSPTSQDKLHSYRAAAPQDHIYNPGTHSSDATATVPPPLTSAGGGGGGGAMAAAPDPLTKAFNEAIRPYLDQIEHLRNELEDMTLSVQQLEDERADMHAWIDKRGLRAGKFYGFSIPLLLGLPRASFMTLPISIT